MTKANILVLLRKQFWPQQITWKSSSNPGMCLLSGAASVISNDQGFQIILTMFTISCRVGFIWQQFSKCGLLTPGDPQDQSNRQSCRGLNNLNDHSNRMCQQHWWFLLILSCPQVFRPALIFTIKAIAARFGTRVGWRAEYVQILFATTS